MVNEFPKMANTQMQMYEIRIMEAIPAVDFRNTRVAYLKKVGSKVEFQFHYKNWQFWVLFSSPLFCQPVEKSKFLNRNHFIKWFNEVVGQAMIQAL